MFRIRKDAHSLSEIKFVYIVPSESAAPGNQKEEGKNAPSGEK